MSLAAVKLENENVEENETMSPDEQSALAAAFNDQLHELNELAAHTTNNGALTLPISNIEATKILYNDLRSRNPNFTDQERNVLINQYVKYRATIQDPKTDSITRQRLQNNLWNCLAHDLNILGNPWERKPKEVRKKWQNVLVAARKDYATALTENTVHLLPPETLSVILCSNMRAAKIETSTTQMSARLGCDLDAASNGDIDDQGEIVAESSDHVSTVALNSFESAPLTNGLTGNQPSPNLPLNNSIDLLLKRRRFITQAHIEKQTRGPIIASSNQQNPAISRKRRWNAAATSEDDSEPSQSKEKELNERKLQLECDRLEQLIAHESKMQKLELEILTIKRDRLTDETKTTNNEK